jgi:hypothetical protein
MALSNHERGNKLVSIHVSPAIEPGGIVFHSQNNNKILYSFDILLTIWELKIFNSALGQL